MLDFFRVQKIFATNYLRARLESLTFIMGWFFLKSHTTHFDEAVKDESYSSVPNKSAAHLLIFEKNSFQHALVRSNTTVFYLGRKYIYMFISTPLWGLSVIDTTKEFIE